MAGCAWEKMVRFICIHPLEMVVFRTHSPIKSLPWISGGHEDAPSFAIWEVILKIGGFIIGIIDN